MRMDMDKEKKRIELYENKNQIVNAAIDRIVVELFHKKEEKEKGQAVLLTGLFSPCRNNLHLYRAGNCHGEYQAENPAGGL